MRSTILKKKVTAFGGETIYNGFPWPKAAKGTRL